MTKCTHGKQMDEHCDDCQAMIHKLVTPSAINPRKPIEFFFSPEMLAEAAERSMAIYQAMLTSDESKLVRHLFEFWEAAWESGPCKTDCDCSKCIKMRQCGDHNCNVFDSLYEKVKNA